MAQYLGEWAAEELSIANQDFYSA